MKLGGNAKLETPEYSIAVERPLLIHLTPYNGQQAVGFTLDPSDTFNDPKRKGLTISVKADWPGVLTGYCEKKYVPKANQGYPTRQAITIRTDGRNVEVPKGGILRFDNPGMLTVYGKVVGGTDHEILLASITAVDGQ